jgi:myo-inositol-1(or 4)-monophosphatase
MRFFRNLDPEKIAEKTKNDLVTEADRASEQTIREVLGKRFPDHSFLGEETGNFGGGSKCWIVDPLDGTLNFAQGFHHWCVSVALWEGGVPLIGCVFDPMHGDLFFTERGNGSYWFQNVDVERQLGGLAELESICVPKRLSISDHHCLDGSFVATGFAFQIGERFTQYLKVLEPLFYRAKGIRRAGSAALDLAHTAAGIYDIYFEMGLQKWDIAAGSLLLQEAGGIITDWDGTDGWWNNGYAVAGNPCVQQQFVDFIRSVTCE